MSKGVLLIVDDEPLILKWLRANLEDYAETVLVAGDGQAAMAILEKEKIHCVICDINMPKLNGVEVIKRLRVFNKNLPFIFYTGHGNADLMLEAAKYGAFDFLNKPDLDGLEEVVQRGLKEGMGENGGAEEVDGLMSEYQKLLKGME